MLVERTKSDALVENHLPDGSRVIIDSRNERVFALNPTAGAAWDACSLPTTLSGVTEKMQHSLHPGITEDLAEEAILQLRKQKLVRTSGSPPQETRRKFVVALGAIALPLVVSLSVIAQRGYADDASSDPKRKRKKRGDGGDD